MLWSEKVQRTSNNRVGKRVVLFCFVCDLVHCNTVRVRGAVSSKKSEKKTGCFESKNKKKRGNNKRLVVLLVLELASGSKGDDNNDRGKNDRADNRDDRDGHGVPEALLLARLADNAHRRDVLEDARAPVNVQAERE